MNLGHARKPRKLLTATACVVLLACGDAAGRIPRPAIDWNPSTYAAIRATDVPVIDGRLDDSSWARARWSENFVDITGAGAAPRYRTRVKMTWDSDFFYIGAEMEEPHVWATLTERDAVIYHDNDFEVFIDPDGDTHEYYELEINPLGTVWDLLLVRPYRDGGPAIDAWDMTGLQSATAVSGTLNDARDVDTGWSVEIAIPWDVLGESAHKPVPPSNGDRWRLNFSRVEWQTAIEGNSYVKLTDPATGDPVAEDNWVWSPQGLVNMHYPEMWGIVEFTDDGQREISVTEIDRARHALYRIYYGQKDWYRRHGRYARGLAELEMLEVPLAGFRATPIISIGPTQFEAIYRGRAGAVHIDQSGRSWVE